MGTSSKHNLLFREEESRNMTEKQKNAVDLHQNVPPDWYARSIRENILQRFWHNKRFNEVGKLIEKANDVLDIGCADGTFTKVIFEKTHAERLIGIDILPKSISFAKRRFARSKKMLFRVADAHSIPYRTESFDAVFCLEALEHVEDPIKVISEIHRVLKKGGYAIILVPSENFLFRCGWPVWTLWRGRVWRGTHMHAIDPRDIPSRLVASGFTIKEQRGFLLGMLQVIKAVKR